MGSLKDRFQSKAAPSPTERPAPEIIKVAIGLRHWGDISTLSVELRPEKRTDILGVANAATMMELYDAAIQHDVDVVILTPDLPGFEQSGLDLVRKLYQHPDHPIITVALLPPGCGDWARTLEQAGAAFHVTSPLREAEVARLIEGIPREVLRAYQHRGTAGTLARLDQETARIVAAQAWEHRTVAVWSPKGGTGKTFVAVNLACLFGVVCNLDTILLDVDMDTGDLFISLDGLGGDFGHTIHELATRWSKGEPLTTKLVESYLIPYQGRLKVLRGIFDSTEGGMAPLVEAEAIAFMGELLRIVRQMASMVVVDMGLSAAHPMHLGALDRADVVLIVLAPTHPSSFRAWSHMGALQREMEISPARFKLILNGYADNMEFDRQGTIQELGLPEFVVIPQDVENEVVRSINRGQPLVLYEPHREVSRQLAVLGAHFYPPLNTIWSQYGGRGLLPKRSLLRRRKH